MPKKIRKLFGAAQGASKMDLDELLGRLPQGTPAQKLEAELMFKRLQEEQAARYAPTNPPTERGKEALRQAQNQLRERGKQKFLEPSTVKQRMYHGTRHYKPGTINFDPETRPSGEGIKEFQESRRGMTFVSPEPEFANTYAADIRGGDFMSGAVYPVHVQVRNPFDFQNADHLDVLTDELSKLSGTSPKVPGWIQAGPEHIRAELRSGSWGAIEDPYVIDAAKRLGFDAMYMNEYGVKNLGVFDPKRIKSAIGNQGTYDITNPDITKAKGGLAHMAGGGKTRAGTKAKPFPWEEQYERSKQRLTNLVNNPMEELQAIVQQYLPTQGDSPEERARKLDDLAMGFAGTTSPKIGKVGGTKVRSTVHEPERMAFPGIYQRPDVIAAEAASRVAAESPNLQKVFGVTRDDLFQMGKGRQGNLPGDLPGAAAKPKGSKAAAKVMTKKNEQRLIDTMAEAEKYPELVRGMDPWYIMDPVYQRMEQLLGRDKAIEEYRKLNTLMGMASPGSEVLTEIPRGTAAYYLQNQGRFSDFAKFAGQPAGLRGADFPQDILNVPGHAYHKTAQATPMQQYLESGEMQMSSPKVPMYIEASGSPLSGFQTRTPVGDAHWSRAVGLADTRGAATRKGQPVIPGASVTNPEMSLLAPWWRESIAAPMGLESVPAQARAWGTFSGQTGVTTPIGAPKIELLADKIAETAQRLGVSLDKARDLVLTGQTYAGKKDGGVVHMQGGGDPGEVSGEMFSPKPLTIPAPLTDLADMIRRQFSKEKRSYSKPGAATDVLLGDVAAPILGAPGDFLDDLGQILDHVQKTHPLMREKASVMDTGPERTPPMGYAPKIRFSSEGNAPYGSEQIREGMERHGLISGERRPLTGLAASILAPGAITKGYKLGKTLAPTAQDMLQMQLERLSEPTRSYVMKPKGGNWLSDAIEGQINPLKSKTSGGQFSEVALPKMESLYTQEALEGMSPQGRASVEAKFPPLRRDAAVNQWINKKLGNYIKNEMGSPEDSIRLGIERRAAEAEKLKAANQAKLDKMAADIERAKAEGKGTAVSERELELAKERFADEEYIASQGLHHDIIPEEGWPAHINWEPEALTYKRRRAGFPEENMASHPAAQDWEIKTDSELSSFKAGDLQKPHLADTPLLEQNQWINKLDPNATINRLEPYSATDLGFEHMIDELKNAVDPASTLPAHLKISTKDLEKMTVDDVSALVGKINAWRNVQKGKANLEIANNPATHTFKEYPPESNPKGVSWRQIKRPEGYSDEEAENFVRQAAQYEGDMMRHCVGGAGHCEPLLRGDVEIYTLRDAKGEPHVTIEVDNSPADMEEFKRAGGNYYEAKREALRRMGLDENENLYNRPREEKDKLAKELSRQINSIYVEQFGQPPKRILEIKGKSNRKPKDDYIPFVQDFIRSGNFSFINDIHNTDLFDVSAGLHKETPKSFSASEGDRLIAITAAKRAGEPLNGLMTREEWEPIVQKYLPQNKADGGAVRMAEGGAVDYESVFNQMLQDHVGMAQGGAVDYESRFNDMLQQHVQGMAEGGAVNPYNEDPDMSDGGRFIPAPAFADGGAVKSIWTVN